MDELERNIKENLHEGMVVKNYPELCRLLNLDKKTGESKINQLSNLERYMGFEKTNSKFIITQIYDRPEVDDFTLIPGNNAVYVNYIACLLAILFKQQTIKSNGPEIHYSRIGLWKSLSMVNKFYRNKYIDEQCLNEICKDSHFTAWEIDNLYSRTYTELKRITKRAFESLEKNGYLSYFNENEIVAVTEDYYFQETGERGTYFQYIHDSEQVETVARIERDVLAELHEINPKVNNKKDLKFHRVMLGDNRIGINEFYQLCALKLKEIYGWTRYYYGYYAVANRKYLDQAKEIYQEKYQKTLNEKCVERMKKDAQHVFEKNITDGKESFILHPSYVYKQNRLTDILVSIDVPKEISKALNRFVNSKAQEENCLEEDEL